jgi:hypothetical protein
MSIALILSEMPKNIDPLRLLEAVDLLGDNGHIEKFPDNDWRKYEIVCTKKGERAINDGFYVKKIIRFWSIILGTPILGILLKLLWQWIM